MLRAGCVSAVGQCCIIASISGRRPNRTDPNREDTMSVFPPQSGGVTPTGAGANRSLFSPDEFPHRTGLRERSPAVEHKPDPAPNRTHGLARHARLRGAGSVPGSRRFALIGDFPTPAQLML